MPSPLPAWITVLDEVAEALSGGRPVVALETTLVTHGLPRPANLQIAHRMEREIRSAGAVPATIGVMEGRVYVGMAADRLERLATAQGARKISRRDLAAGVAKRWAGGTTVAATMALADLAGIRVFATGGIGGVHRGQDGDVSADLPELARTHVAVLCSGAKSILDLRRTLEWLETAGVPVLGWETDDFPAFFSRSSALPVTARVDGPEEAAAAIRAHWALKNAGGVLVCAPCPADVQVPQADMETALRQAEAEAAQKAVRGPALTPFLLDRVADLTGGATLRANLALLAQNARLAGRLAAALAA
ncbi:MAG TPA: pseudouridine-5'-phosphate glycosidase [Anaerolineales bacterium]|nr:pseudouridine-5'-phosphate glycosidase [Anaerolineales bacterium]